MERSADVFATHCFETGEHTTAWGWIRSSIREFAEL